MPSRPLATAASTGFRVARTMYERWRRMKDSDRERLEDLAAEVKELAMELRGNPDRTQAGVGLQQASTRLADAMVESAQSDPDFSDSEVAALRGDLSRELERLASGEVQASRATPPPSPAEAPSAELPATRRTGPL